MAEKNGQAPAVAPADVARIWAVMSHEIRTPLMGVVGMLEVLNRTGLTDEQRRIISTAEDSSVALMRIIDDVLDFAKLESATVQLDEAPADPAAILEGTAELLANVAEGKPLAITCEIVGDVPPVICDALRLRQVLLNIGANAVKYTESGMVALKVAVLSETAAALTLRFSVADTGAGVPVELQGFLFQPFWQLAGREASRSGMGGVGLGLAICRTLVDAMGGRIVVESRPGGGTCFSVEAAFARAGSAPAPAPRLEDTEVVAVDTGDPSLAVALRALEASGAAVLRVDSLGALGRHPPAGRPRAVALLGPETEAEDVEATALALGRMGTGHFAAIVWLHRGAAGTMVSRAGVAAVRTNPMRRAELFAAVAGGHGARDLDGAAVVARRYERLVDPGDVLQAARADGFVILVAEDNKVNQEVLRQQLAILGYDCDVAASGHAALKALGERRYPLLLCDCHMPGMDGFELTRLIRAKEGAGAARMPIIAVTANAVPGEAARCRAAGMDDYLAKPIEIGALQAKLERWLGAATPRAGTPPVARVQPAERVLDLRGLTLVYGNDPKRLAPVVEQWSGAMRDLLADLESAVAAAAWEGALAAAHRIKGSAGVAGAGPLSAASASLEVALREGDGQAIAREMARVRALTLAGLKEAADWGHGPGAAQAAVSEKAAAGVRI